MMNNSRTMTEAAGWLLRRRDPHFADWDGLTDWLESDPANADAYAGLAADEEAIAERIVRERLAGDRARYSGPPARMPVIRRRAMAGMAMLAAALLAVAGIYQFAPGRSLYPVSTPPGGGRTVTLAGSAVLRLNGSTLVRLDRDDPRYVEVQQGEVMFEVVHDASRQFLVKVEGAELRDMGTKFNVLREANVTQVGVSEGAVRYEAGGETVDLTPGRQLRAVDGEEALLLSTIDPNAVGSWTSGRLIYDNAPLSVVASDISRSIGQRVEVDPRLAARPVTAAIRISDDPDKLAPRLENLLDVKVRRTKDGWILTEDH